MATVEKTQTVEVDAAALAAMLQRVLDGARALHARYDRGKRHYVFNDEVWHAADPYEFTLYQRLKASADGQSDGAKS